jgi:hypothetical protein
MVARTLVVANFTQSRSQNGSPKHSFCQSSIHTCVKGQWFLPVGGQWFCPLVAIRVAH